MAGLRFSGFMGRKVPYIEVPYIGIRLYGVLTLFQNFVKDQKHPTWQENQVQNSGNGQQTTDNIKWQSVPAKSV